MQSSLQNDSPPPHRFQKRQTNKQAKKSFSQVSPKSLEQIEAQGLYSEFYGRPFHIDSGYVLYMGGNHQTPTVEA